MSTLPPDKFLSTIPPENISKRSKSLNGHRSFYLEVLTAEHFSLRRVPLYMRYRRDIKEINTPLFPSSARPNRSTRKISFGPCLAATVLVAALLFAAVSFLSAQA